MKLVVYNYSQVVSRKAVGFNNYLIIKDLMLISNIAK